MGKKVGLIHFKGGIEMSKSIHEGWKVEKVRINSIKSELMELKREEQALKKQMRNLEEDGKEANLVEKLSFLDQRIKDLGQTYARYVFCRRAHTTKPKPLGKVSLEDPPELVNREPEDRGFFAPMKVVNKKSQYHGQKVKPLKRVNYGDNLVIQVKLENGRTEIFDPEDLTGV